MLDAPTHDRAARLQFLARQKQLLEGLLAGMAPATLQPEERMLVDVLAGRRDRHPGLRSYLERMMAVMEFDAGRRGRLISDTELDRYSQLLAGAVMDAIGYFIGHDHVYPTGTAARLQAVTGAHIIHMLRDTADDLAAGYFNVPRSMFESPAPGALRPSPPGVPAVGAGTGQRGAPVLCGWKTILAPRRLPAGADRRLAVLRPIRSRLAADRARRLPAAVRIRPLAAPSRLA